MKKLFFICFFLKLSAFMMAQSAVVSLGNTTQNNNLLLSQSVGQVASSSGCNTTASIHEGVQQLYEISELNIENLAKLNVNIKVYPNPTADNVNIKVCSNTDLQTLNYTLFSADGKQILNGSIKNLSSQLPMKQYVSGIYFLKITSKNSNAERNYRIIKY